MRQKLLRGLEQRRDEGVRLAALYRSITQQGGFVHVCALDPLSMLPPSLSIRHERGDRVPSYAVSRVVISEGREGVGELLTAL